jgi:hypothetical protein
MEPSKTPASASPPQEAAANDICPRCNAKLTNPDSLGWCPKCGYCRSLEDGGAAITAGTSPARKPSALGIVEFIELVKKMPPWVKVLLAGVLAIVLVSVAGHFVLPAGESYSRALWSTTELGLGLLAIIVGQFWALVLLAPRDDKLGAKDAFIPFRLWSIAAKQVPLTTRPVWLGAWGLSAGVCAVLVVGGLSYWTQFYKPKKIAQTDIVEAAGALKKKVTDKDLVESVKDVANTQDLTKGKEKGDKEKPDTRPTVQCVILGYLADGSSLKGLIIATASPEKKLVYSGIVRKGFTPENSVELLKELAKRVRSDPDPRFRTLRIPDAIWIDPNLYCEVHQSGATREGQLLTPNYKGLLEVR